MKCCSRQPLNLCITKLISNQMNTITLPGNSLDLEGMSLEDLKALALRLIQENFVLKGMLPSLNAQIAGFGDKLENSEKIRAELLEKLTNSHLLSEQNEKLNEEIRLFKEENEELKREIQLLKEENEELKREIQLLKEEKDELKQKNSNFEERIATLENVTQPISLREAMRILENKICFNISGSMKKYRNNYSFQKIRSGEDEQLKANLQEKFNQLGLTSDHLTILDYLKDSGDFVAHKPPSMLISEWRIIVKTLDQDIQTLTDDLLSALSTFCPFPERESDSWNIIGVGKAVTEPTFTLSGASALGQR